MQSKTQLRYDRVTLSIIVNSAQSFAFNYIANGGAFFCHFGSIELASDHRKFLFALETIMIEENCK